MKFIFKDIEERVNTAEAWVDHIKNAQDEVITTKRISKKGNRR